jgi:hypothetical protein
MSTEYIAPTGKASTLRRSVIFEALLLSLMPALAHANSCSGNHWYAEVLGRCVPYAQRQCPKGQSQYLGHCTVAGANQFPERFIWRQGEFALESGKWIERDNGHVAFNFVERQRTTSELILFDESRFMLLKIPLAGGRAQWRQKKAEWTPWEVVWPW